MKNAEKNTPVALSIAGSDSGGGAGIQADLRAFAANGVFGTTAITCITAQNPDGVSAVTALDPGLVAEQAEQVFRFFNVGAVKTGMLFSEAIIAAVVATLKNRSIPLVVDPVMVATSGAVLLQPGAVTAVKRDLIPLASIVTPNLDEAAVLLGKKPKDAAEARAAAIELAQIFSVPFLVKGGHLEGDSLTDIVAWPDGKYIEFHTARIQGVDTHGSGCTLASAIAARLALGENVLSAVQHARDYLRRSLLAPLGLGTRRFINHHSG